MKAMMVLAGLMVAAGGAGALGLGGNQNGGNGADLVPFAEGCLCHGYGTWYGLWSDDQGRFNLHHSMGGNVGHYTPPTAGPEVGFDLGAGRWVNAWGSVPDGRVDVDSNGGGGLHTPGPGEGGLVNQGFGLVDVRAHADRDGHAQVFVRNTIAGSAVGNDFDVCAGTGPGLPGGTGANVFAQVNGFPAGAGIGRCGFMP